MKANTGIKTVIVGVDFSKYSKLAALQAKSIAQKLKVPLVFVHIYEDPVVAEWNDSAAKKSLTEHYTKRIKEQYKTSSNNIIIAKCGGRAFEEIISVAKGFQHPFIVVSDRGEGSKLVRNLFGSTAERLSLQSPFPVVIHKGHKTNYPHKILLPVDFSNRSRNAIEGTKKLGFNSSQVEIYHVFQLPVPVLDYQTWNYIYETAVKNNTHQVAKFKRKYQSYKVTETESNDVSGCIEKRGKKFDLIAISPREHRGLLPSFGSVTSKLIRSGSTSVLVIP